MGNIEQGLRAELGAQLRDLRKALSLTQAEVGHRTAESVTTISNREAGLKTTSDASLAATLAALEADSDQRCHAWQLLFRSQGHPFDDAQRMAKAKVLHSEAA